MNRSDVRTLVIDTTGRSDKTTLINSAINIALAKISSAHLWNDLLTSATASLSVGVNTVALASDARRISEIRVMDGLSSAEICVRPKHWVVGMFPDPTAYSNAKPRLGYIEGTTLYMVPAPDAVYSGLAYTYYKPHADLSDDTTEISIPHADEAVVAYTTYWVFKSIEKHNDAAQWFGDYTVCLRDAKKMDMSSVVQTIATPRGFESNVPGDYWLDPFARSNP